MADYPTREYIIRETTYPDATKQEAIGELVRCKDCIRFRPDDDVWGRCTVMPYRMRKNDYCSYGVIDDMRKDGEQHG